MWGDLTSPLGLGGAASDTAPGPGLLLSFPREGFILPPTPPSGEARPAGPQGLSVRFAPKMASPPESLHTTNVQNSFFNDNYVYVASTGIPNYEIGPFPGSALLPGNQRKLNRFPLAPSTISSKDTISPGPIGTWVNGVSVWSYKSPTTKTFGAITGVTINNSGSGYDLSLIHI